MHTSQFHHLRRKTGAVVLVPVNLPHTQKKHISTHQHGFSMIELVLAMTVMGVMTLIYSQNTGGALSAFTIAQDEEQEALNKRLASVLLDYAATVSPIGKLPDRYISGATKYAIYDPINTNLQSSLVEARINPRDANDTQQGYARVYQIASPITINLPLYGATGPLVTIGYQEAVIVATHCRRSDTCNTTGTGGIPGSSGKFDSSNLQTYALTGDDFGLSRFSTLSLQKLKLAQTVDNLDAIRTRMQELFRERQRQADANDTTNFFPHQLGGASALAYNTIDCHSGWFYLHNSDILPQIGLTANQYGLNAWGGQIHYCPDYDPSTGKAPDAAPHFAAIRILSNPSAGGNPTAVNAANIIIPF